MKFTAEQISSKDPAEIAEWAGRMFRNIELTFRTALARQVEFLHVEPAKPFEGLTVGADGTDWNPGGGQGVYTYYNSGWHKLG